MPFKKQLKSVKKSLKKTYLYRQTPHANKLRKYEVIFHSQNKYLSLEAFNSSTASLYDNPKSCLARHNILVVLPIPGDPFKYKSKLDLMI